MFLFVGKRVDLFFALVETGEMVKALRIANSCRHVGVEAFLQSLLKEGLIERERPNNGTPFKYTTTKRGFEVYEELKKIQATINTE